MTGSDVLVIGAGCMGASVAAHLVRSGSGLEVTVLDRDLTLQRSSTLLSDGNVRVQFHLPENIAISVYAMEALKRFPQEFAAGDHVPHVHMRQQGNLFLADTDGEAEAQAGVELQRSLGGEVEWLGIAEITRRWAPLAADGLSGGSFGRRDGSVDPSAVTIGYRRYAEAGGAVFRSAEVSALLGGDDGISGVRLADGSRYRADVVVVCGGAWSTGLLATAGVDIPVVPTMRTVYVVASDVGKGLDLPSVFLPSGLYLIPEGEGTYLIAWSLPDDPVGFDFTPADRSRFYDVIWPELASTLPAFDRLEVVRSWAGLYAQNLLDSNAIVGEWPSLPGLYQATGFSGHGFQQCHAVGRYLAELIAGAEPFLDLSRLGPERVVAGEPLAEHAGRLI